ncbi:flippase [Alkalispirochaeta alkalica]|uniref:flippase n=1 Tax=Alkalispirochaeta alkalica TaxID=46356 RepID=UPI0003A887ED|nr:flippase [Alkalispirochaeta alkalica]
MKKTVRRSFFKDALSIFTSKIAVLLISFVNGVLLARLLGPEGKGVVAAILVYPGLLISLFELGIRQSVIYHIGRDDFDRNTVIGAIVWLFVMTSLIGSSVTFFLLLPRIGVYPTLAIFFAISLVPLRLVKSYAGGIMVGAQQFSSFSRILWIPPFISLIGTLMLVWYLGTGVVGAIAATFSGALIVAIYALVIAGRSVGASFRFSTPVAIRLFRMGILYAVSLFVINLNYRIDIIFLEHLTDTAEVGYYSLGVRFAELVWQVPSAVGVVVFARSAAAKGSQVFSLKVLQLFRVVLVLCSIIAALLWFTADWFIPLIYGEAFRASSGMMKFLLPGIVFAVLYKVIHMDMAGRGKPWKAMIASIPALVVNLILNMLFIPRFGGSGAAVASSFSYAIIGVSYLFVYLDETGLKFKDVLRFRLSDFPRFSEYGR